jgi:hypothetical protein
MTNNTDRPVIIDLVAVLQANLMANKTATASPEYGWVIYSKRRGGYVCQPDATSTSKMVGLTQDPNEARFFPSHQENQADICAFWQQGTPLPAIRVNGKIRLQ